METIDRARCLVWGVTASARLAPPLLDRARAPVEAGRWRSPPVGLLIAIGLSWVFLDVLGGAWRWLFVAAALPAFVAAVARRALPVNLGAWGAVYPYSSELFPTRLRSTAFGMVEGVGKAAAIAGPYLFGYLLDAPARPFGRSPL